MKKNKLIQEERKILKDIEKNKYKSVPNVKEVVQKYQYYALNTMKKTKNINIRISLSDLEKLKLRAIENGLPYQTLVSMIIRQYVNKKININI